MRGDLPAVYGDTHCHHLSEEAFLDRLNVAIVNSGSKIHCNLVCITVHASPDIQLIVRSLVILMGFYPLESVSKC